MTFNFSQTTQYGGNFGVTAVQQNGFTTGQLTGINIDQTGVVQAQFTNGRSVDLGQVALANFANPQGLAAARQRHLGRRPTARVPPSTAWPAAPASAQVQSGSLEESNVDITAPWST